MAKTTKGKSTAADEGLALHTTFRLPRELHERLTKASGDKGIGEEIRRRLEASFESDANAQADLVLPIAEAADLASQYFGDWRKDAFAFAVLKAALETILKRYKPSGEAKLKFDPDSIADVIFSPSDTPERAGATLAGWVLHSLSKKGKAS